MIFIVVKFKVKPDWTDRWLDLTRDFTEATRQEPGNLWFDWSRSVEDPNEFILVEAFQDDAAGDHVNSAHFVQAMQDMPQALRETPEIISEKIEGHRLGTDGRTHRQLTGPAGGVGRNSVRRRGQTLVCPLLHVKMGAWDAMMHSPAWHRCRRLLPCSTSWPRTSAA